MISRLQFGAFVHAGQAHQAFEMQIWIGSQGGGNFYERFARNANHRRGLNLFKDQFRLGKSLGQVVEDFLCVHAFTGCLAMVSRSIFSRNFRKPSIRASGRGGQPGT